MVSKKDIIRFVKYIFFNGVIWIFNLLLFYIFNEWLKIYYLISSLASYAIVVIISFFCNKLIVFNAKANVKRSLSEFVVVKVGMGILSTGAMKVAVDICRMDKYIASIVVTGIFFLLTFFLSKIIFLQKGLFLVLKEKSLAYLKLMRVSHYFKNLVVVIPAFFSGKICNVDVLQRVFMGIVIFSLTASAVYIINDLVDVENDRKHPRKCHRPLASGKIKKGNAILFEIVLLLSIFVLNYIFFVHYKCGIETISIIFIYGLINIIYSYGRGKNVQILDICIVVSGYVLRLIYGGIIIDVEVSKYLYLTVLMIAFYLTLGKRRKAGGAEVTIYSDSLQWLDKMSNISMVLILVYYSLWSIFEGGTQIKEKTYIMVPLVFIIVMKYSLDLDRTTDGDPMNIILNDKILCLLTIVYVILMMIIIYL